MLKGKAVIFTVILAALAVLIVPCCRAQQDLGKSPDELRTNTINDVNVAIRLVKQAQDMLGAKPTKENMQAAAGLYAQAGQLFEKSEMMFKALGKNYASQDDIDQCGRLKNECLQALTSLKKAMQ